MPFTVETGTGDPDANAYITLAFANDYHLIRGNSKWAGSDTVKQAAIIRATDYIDKRFGKRFRGTRRQKDQALEWPRLSAYDDDDFYYTGIDIVPRKLQQGCAEYALRALLLGELAPDVPSSVPAQRNEMGEETETTVTTGEVVSKTEKIGPIEESTTYAPRGQTIDRSRSQVSELVSTLSIPEYPAADLLLQELLRSGNARTIVRG